MLEHVASPMFGELFGAENPSVAIAADEPSLRLSRAARQRRRFDDVSRQRAVLVRVVNRASADAVTPKSLFPRLARDFQIRRLVRLAYLVDFKRGALFVRTPYAEYGFVRPLPKLGELYRKLPESLDSGGSANAALLNDYRLRFVNQANGNPPPHLPTHAWA